MTPTPSPSFFEELVRFLKENGIAGGLFLLLWNATGKVATHFSEKRKAEFLKIAEEAVDKYCKEELEPELAALRARLDATERRVEHLQELILNKK